MNAPSTSTCSVSTSGWAYQDPNKNPAVYYCPKWSQNLLVYATSSGSVTVTGSHTHFWGVITAPHQTVTLNSPQLELWGAMVAGNVNASSQFSWHYDEYLMSVTNGKFSLSNWHEVPV